MSAPDPALSGRPAIDAALWRTREHPKPFRFAPALLQVFALAPVLGAIALGATAPAAAQLATAGAADTAWGSPGALALAELGRSARAGAREALRDRPPYRTRALGLLRFFLDRPATGERSLVRADRLAVDIHWSAGFGVRQQLVGWKDEEFLPTRLHYHLDHLIVLHDGLEPVMSLGNGDEVAGVPHPLAAGSENTYEYRLGESVELVLGAGGDTIQLRELMVRPQTIEEPAVVGSLHLDLSSGAIVRMNHTFTPSSYVDPLLDYVRMSLENGYWTEGRAWLPRRQTVELRREPRFVDLLGGSVIRTEYEVGPYEFGDEAPAAVWNLPPVTTLPESVREVFDFPDELGRFGSGDLRDPPELEAVRSAVARTVLRSTLEELAPPRLFFSRVSEIARYNRAEGFFLGGGLSFEPSADADVRASGGYAFGPAAPSFSVSFGEVLPERLLALRLAWDEVVDIGMKPALDPALNSFATAFGWGDHFDHMLVRGASIEFSDKMDGLTLKGEFRRHLDAHPQEGGPLTHGPGERPYLAPREGIMVRGEIGKRVALGRGPGLSLFGAFGALNSEYFHQIGAALEWTSDTGGPVGVQTSLEGGFASRGAPPQELFLLGGQGTIPGHGYRSVVGDRYLLAHGEVTVPIYRPWVSMRLLAGAGWAEVSPERHLPPDWERLEHGALIAGFGAGVALGWELLRLEIARGVGEDWELYISLSPRLRSWS